MTGRRENGVEFGEFDDRLEGHSYPTTAGELVAEYGELVVSLVGGSETVAEVLGPVDEEYTSAEDVRQSVCGLVGIDAVGRKRYTDRDPPTPGEQSGGPVESF